MRLRFGMSKLRFLLLGIFPIHFRDSVKQGAPLCDQAFHTIKVQQACHRLPIFRKISENQLQTDEVSVLGPRQVFEKKRSQSALTKNSGSYDQRSQDYQLRGQARLSEQLKIKTMQQPDLKETLQSSEIKNLIVVGNIEEQELIELIQAVKAITSFEFIDTCLMHSPRYGDADFRKAVVICVAHNIDGEAVISEIAAPRRVEWFSHPSCRVDAGYLKLIVSHDPDSQSKL